MRQKENYKVRHHFYNTIITSNSPQTPQKTNRMTDVKATRKKRRIESYPAQLLVLQGQDPCALCEELHFDRWQRVCGGEVSLGSPTENTHTHTHTQTTLMSLVSGFYLFSTHFLHSQTQTVQPSMWFFKGSCTCWTAPFKTYRNANIWLSSGIIDLLDTRPLFITLSLHNRCAQGHLATLVFIVLFWSVRKTISAVLFGYMAGLMKMFANKSFDKVVKILYWMSSAWETDQWVKCIVWCFCT